MTTVHRYIGLTFSANTTTSQIGRTCSVTQRTLSGRVGGESGRGAGGGSGRDAEGEGGRQGRTVQPAVEPVAVERRETRAGHMIGGGSRTALHLSITHTWGARGGDLADDTTLHGTLDCTPDC